MSHPWTRLRLSGPNQGRSVNRSNAFLLAAAILIPLIYWLSLKFIFPGYFSPLVPFHVDFYDYVSVQEQSVWQLLTRYPRPIAYLAMKIMGIGDVKYLIACEIVVSGFGVFLTLALVRRLFHLGTDWSIYSLVVYLALLFTHPDFYFEHRHDLPAEVSYLFLLICLLSWLSWSRAPSLRRAPLLAVSVLSAICFVLSKESFFGAALCLVLGVALVDKERRKLHLCMLGLLFSLVLASLWWNKHLNGPFVNANNDPHATYFLDPGLHSILNTYIFYLYYAVTPGLVLLLSWALWTARHNSRRMVMSSAFVLAGLSVFLPHSVLPNHRFEEYSWIAAPLLFAPILLLNPAWKTCRGKTGYAVALASLFLIAVIGPEGYQSRYHTEVLRWMVDQDIRGGLIFESLEQFDALRGHAADIVISGLDDPSVPWQKPDYIHWRFGSELQWTVAFPPGIESRRDSSLVRFLDANRVRMRNGEFLAVYDPRGRLSTFTPVALIDRAKPMEEVLNPTLAHIEKQLEIRPKDSALLMQCADVAVIWGFWARAKYCLDSIKNGDAARDANYLRLRSSIPENPQTLTP